MNSVKNFLFAGLLSSLTLPAFSQTLEETPTPNDNPSPLGEQYGQIGQLGQFEGDTNYYLFNTAPYTLRYKLGDTDTLLSVGAMVEIPKPSDQETWNCDYTPVCLENDFWAFREIYNLADAYAAFRDLGNPSTRDSCLQKYYQAPHTNGNMINDLANCCGLDDTVFVKEMIFFDYNLYKSNAPEICDYFSGCLNFYKENYQPHAKDAGDKPKDLQQKAKPE